MNIYELKNLYRLNFDQFMNYVEEKHKPKYNYGDIYVLYNKISCKCYIGQAKKYTDGTRKYGTTERWKSHVREALSYRKNNTSIYLNNAIRKYGKDSFLVFPLKECHENDLDFWETYYIKLLNTMYPNGYNLTSGGRKNFKVSGIIKEKIRKKIKGVPKSKSACYNNGISQLGKRFESRNKRKYIYNHKGEILPKYISPAFEKNIQVGYRISSYPIGINEKKVLNFTAQNKNNLDESYEKIIKKLEELNKKYEHLNNNIENFKKEHLQENIKISIKKEKNLPENIYPILCDAKIIGYEVKNVRDMKNELLPSKKFIHLSCNYLNLLSAKNYLQQLNIYKKNQDFSEGNILNNFKDIPLNDKTKLPLYLRFVKKNNIKIGYRIEFPINNNIIQKIFTNSKKTFRRKIYYGIK